MHAAKTRERERVAGPDTAARRTRRQQTRPSWIPIVAAMPTDEELAGCVGEVDPGVDLPALDRQIRKYRAAARTYAAKAEQLVRERREAMRV